MQLRRHVPPLREWKLPVLEGSRVRRWAAALVGAVLGGYLTAYLVLFPAPLLHGHGVVPRVLGLSLQEASDQLRKAGSAGKPYPFVDVDVSADGELLVRGPNVSPGYWRNPAATSETIVDGWLRTGDVVERDDEGYFWIRGRLKEMFISGGENVYPAEVESVLHEHTRVRDAAVVGVPDERWGEVGVAYVVGDATEDELLAFCAARLAKYKVPKSVRFVEELPRNSMGKIRRAELAVPA